MTARERLKDAVPSIVLLVVAAFYAYTATAYDPQTRAMPLGVALIAILLVVLDLVSRGEGALARNLRRVLQGSGAKAPVPGLDGQAGQRHPALRELGAFAWIGGFLALVILVGFYPAIPIYMVAYLRFYAKKPLVAAVATAAVVTGLLYAMFELLLGYSVFEGLIMGDYM
ncbi:tripartite tricarboxylate transporter TctB family protein [Lutibaculum baratangense]|uniref:DUF1468 domain-containing protein n=1 Tax=Lutibaculum baratangense AMV1 TaxID=631454 RepID=V4THS6_9HYPH|nr:tripartite tricarboxylate transporter TctB family protein [Lutibaculum baratangense]ESR25583.1 hypothetical protein N177_1695 [Lutibaculum baratangense AMV1]